MLYDYFFESPSTQDAVVSADAMNVVNLIDGYISMARRQAGAQTQQ